MSRKINGGISILDSQEVGFFDLDSSNSIALRAPDVVSADVEFRLPASDVAGVMKSDGSGNLSLSLLADADVSASAAIQLSKLAPVTANRAVVSDGSGNLISSASVTDVEIGHLSGVSSNVQSQLNTLSSSITNFEWQESVIDRLATPPVSPSSGDRYLVIATASGDWAGQEDKIADFNGASWDFITPTVGTYLSVDDESDRLYLYGGSSWDAKQFEATTASTGLVKVGLDVQLDSSAAGDGLGFSAGVLSANVDDLTIQIASDALELKDGGILDAKISASAAIQFSKMEDLTASRALVSDGSGDVSVSAVTSSELGHLSGVTSALQTQLDAKAATDLSNLSVSGLADESLLVGVDGNSVESLPVGSEGQVLKVVSGSLAWAADAGVSSFKTDWITADGASKTILHSLGTLDVRVELYDKSDGATIEVDDVIRTDANTLDLTASRAPGASGWRILISAV